ncbi:MAG TPA: sigma-70 family RNA polymerase sigma factor [Pirellulales bacterium]|nr:sigma-70 family RNA polymerase sigma factor [Pirellulales bacterium]
MTNAPQAAVAEQQPDLSNFSDEDLLLRYRDSSDAAAFQELLHRYERELFNYLSRYLRDQSLAEEVFQTVFLRVHERARLFEEGRAFRPWIYSIATHQAIDALRKTGRRPTTSLDAIHGDAEMDGTTLLDMLEDRDGSPAKRLEEHERSEWARRAVDELPEHLRDVVLLIYFQGLKFREAAEILGIPLGTAKSRMHEALVRLNAAWRRNHPASQES